MKKFDTVFRGYDKYQVQKCLDEIINNLKKVKKQKMKIKN